MKNNDYFGRKLFSTKEVCRNIYYGLRSIRPLKDAINKNIISEKLKERIMLSVTEVNGCSMCSYAHTKIAMEAGLSDEEIKYLLQGVFEDVPKEDVMGIMFSQYYAQNRGIVSKESVENLVKEYNEKKAKAIINSTQIIMMGNSFGIPVGSFKSRFKKDTKKDVDERSNIFYEISMILLIIIFLPIGIISAFLGNLLKRPIVKYEKTN